MVSGGGHGAMARVGGGEPQGEVSRWIRDTGGSRALYGILVFPKFPSLSSCRNTSSYKWRRDCVMILA